MSSLDLTVLDRFRREQLPDGYLPFVRTLYSPVDDVHGALVLLLKSATSSLDVAMYGFDDEELAGVLLEKMRSENVRVTLTLDSSQAGGVHERKLLAGEDFPSTSVAVGRSEKNAIMHMKCIVVDRKIRISGSTNWSDGGEREQDNEFTVIANEKIAGEAADRIGEIHAHMLRAAAAAKAVAG